MSFSSPATPPPLALPQAPAPVAPLQFTSTQQKPGRKGSQPTSLVSESLTAGQSMLGARSLIGAA